MADRFAGMRVFSEVAKAGAISRAARALRMSATMATKHVDALEARLGVRLLHRTTRRLTLTEAGRDYLSACERILADVAEADAAAAEGRAHPRGLLRVSAPNALGQREVMPLLPAFLALYPDLQVEMTLNDRFVDLAAEGFDMAIRIGALSGASLIARKLAPARMLVCAAPAYLAQAGRPETTADLARHACLGYTLPEPASAFRWLFGARGEIVAPIAPRLFSNNGEALRAAAVAGAGLVYLPSFIAGEDLRAGRLVAVDLDAPPAELDGVYAVTPPGRIPQAKTRALVAFLADAWAAPPWGRARR